jgi:hypothetical protein
MVASSASDAETNQRAKLATMSRRWRGSPEEGGGMLQLPTLGELPDGGQQRERRGGGEGVVAALELRQVLAAARQSEQQPRLVARDPPHRLVVLRPAPLTCYKSIAELMYTRPEAKCLISLCVPMRYRF